MFPIAEVNVIDLAFPCNVSEIMPAYKDIPDQFKHDGSKWNRFFNDMFFCGIKNVKLKPRPGVDEAKAFAHIRAVSASFEPKREHKEAAVAYLMDQWFEDGTWEAVPFKK